MEKECSLSHYDSMNVLSMHALIAAYSPEGSEWADELCAVLAGNIDFACNYIKTRFDGVEVTKPEGTYILFADCTNSLYMDSLCSHHAEIQYLYLIYTVYNVIILPFHSCKKKREPFTALFHIDFLIHLSYLTVWQPMSLNFFPKMGQSLVLHQMPSQLLSFAHILLQIPMQIHNSKHLSE